MYRLVERNCYGDKNEIYHYEIFRFQDVNGSKRKNHEQK